jgi:hypothetical protein
MPKPTFMSFRPVLLLACSLLLMGCTPSDEEKKRLAEEKRRACQDQICQHDQVPKPGPGEMVMKLNHEYYFAPVQYVLGNSSVNFYWPSKTPATGRPDGQPYPEQRLGITAAGIEVFLQSRRSSGPVVTRRQRLMNLESSGHVTDRSQPRQGLEIWNAKDTVTSRKVVWYVATDQREPDGDPPILYCEASFELHNTCTTGFYWRPDVSVYVRFSAAHGPDWPEIYQEIARVLNLIRKA